MRCRYVSFCLSALLFTSPALAADYYVNDAVTNGDMWCTAPGHLTNSGLTVALPALQLQDILDGYDLEPGDTLYVDTGYYALSANVTVGPADGGADGNPVTVLGTGTNTLIDRADTGGTAYGFHLNGAEYVVLRELAVVNAGQAVRLEGGRENEVRNCELADGGRGVVLASGADHVVAACRIHDLSAQGILGSSSAGPVLVGNEVHSCTPGSEGRGIDLSSCSLATLANNTVHDNDDSGLRLLSCASPTISSNSVYGNGGAGVYLQSCTSADVSDNALRGNATGVGAVTSGSLALRRNAVHSNAGDGITATDGTLVLSGNLVYANGGNGFAGDAIGASTLESNTIYTNSAAALELRGNYGYADLRNNILSACGPAQVCLRVESLPGTWTSDYNDFYAVEGAAVWDWEGPRYELSSWQFHSGQDRRSTDADPLFVDPDGADDTLGGDGGDDDDFHLQSTVGSYHGGAWSAAAGHSTCIDAGDLANAYAAEPDPNGMRINLGAYGNTPQASKSLAERAIRISSPNGGENLFRRADVRWAAWGPWTTNDYVKIEYSPDDGGSWLAAPNANPLAFNNGVYSWDVSGLATGNLYRVRATWLADTNITDASDATFAILPAAGRVFYVNDGSTSGDEWCTAAGAATNTGLSAGSPLDSLSLLLERYAEIGPGDEVRVDAGTHDEGRKILLTAVNAGTEGDPLTIRGTGAGTSVFDGLGAGHDGFHLDGTDYIRLEDLRITGAAAAIRISGESTDPCRGMQVTGCVLDGNSSGLTLSYCPDALVDGVHATGCSGSGIYLHDSDGPTVRNCTVSANGQNGIYLDQCGGVVVNTNTCEDNGGDGIVIAGAGTVATNLCEGNVCLGNDDDGIDARGTFRAAGNTCHNNDRYGIYLTDGSYEVRGNRCGTNVYRGISVHGAAEIADNEANLNGREGIYAYGGDVLRVTGNRAFGNGYDGIFFAWAADQEASRNVAHGNARNGISTWGRRSPTLVNNLCYSNGTSSAYYNIYAGYYDGYYHTWGDNRCTIENNTAFGGNGLFVGKPVDVTVRNNILHAVGSGNAAFGVQITPTGGDVLDSDYNNLYASGGAGVGFWQGNRPDLAAWQGVSGTDANSVSIEPRFVDTATPDFHLRSTAGSYGGEAFTAPVGGVFSSNLDVSFCIDGGDPGSDYANESTNNGGRVNMGAFGNTADASRAPWERVSMVTEPRAGVQWFGVRTVYWLTRGPWEAGDTVNVEYSDNAGGSWFTVSNGIDYAAGQCDWDTGAVTPGSNYLVRLYKSDDNDGASTNAGLFIVAASGPRIYYVNDASTSNDVYCTATGQGANDALTPGTPKASIQNVFDTYNVEPGDTIKVDTGYYTMSNTLIIASADAGADGAPVSIIGSTHDDGTLLNRNDAGNHGVYLYTTDYIRFEKLRLTGAAYAFRLDGEPSDHCTGIEIADCRLFGNGSTAVNGEYCSDLVVEGSTVCSNSGYGLYLEYCYDVAAVSNQVFKNSSSYSGIRLRGSGDITGNEVYQSGVHGVEALPSSGVIILTGNESHHNSSDGIKTDGGTVEVSDNDCHHNAGIGIYASGSAATLTANQAHHNSREGIYLYSTYQATPALIEHNRVYKNGYEGIFLAWGAAHVARRNVVHDNGRHGIWAWLRHNEQVVNNLCYGNGTAGAGYYNIYVGYTTSDLYGQVCRNTVYGGNGLLIGSPKNVTVDHNILWATGSNSVACMVQQLPATYTFEMDYNNLYATDGAGVGSWLGAQPTLADWQYASGWDPHSFSVDPLFVDADGVDNVLGGTNGFDDNFHLCSTEGSYTGAPFTAATTNFFAADAKTSFCVDAARPGDDWDDELTPHGERLNLGAFAGTTDASLSDGLYHVRLMSVIGGEVLRGIEPVTWITAGPWETGDTVALNCTTNGGAEWRQILGAEALPFETGAYDWDTGAMTPGSDYQLRIEGSMGPPASYTSGVFRILPPGPATFYVNDGFTNNDVYCTVVGSDTNDGVTASTPKATVKGLLVEYVLIPGDLVKIDTGTWVLDSTLQLRDSGSVAQTIRFLGSTHAQGTVFNRANNGATVILVNEADDLRFERIRATGGAHGFFIQGTAGDRRQRIELVDCEAFANWNTGIRATYADDMQVTDCDTHDNTSSGYGIYFDYCDRPRIEDCTSTSNSYAGIWLERCYDLLVKDCFCRYSSSAQDGIKLTTCTGSASGNECRNYYYAGIYSSADSGTVVLSGNHLHHNGTGIEVGGGYAHEVRGNEVHDNGSDGIRCASGAGTTIEDNRAYRNGGDGIELNYSGWYRTIRRNVTYSNGGCGINATAQYGPIIANNLVYANDTSSAGHYNLRVGYQDIWGGWHNAIGTVSNNTVYGRNGLQITKPWDVICRNNIIVACESNAVAIGISVLPAEGYTLTCDFNAYAIAGGAYAGWWQARQETLADWQHTVGVDAHSFMADPRFVDADGGDNVLGGTNGFDDNFHLRSTAGSYTGLPFTAVATAGFSADGETSPGVDAGNSTAPVRDELAPHGDRVNLGAFGGTADASLSPQTPELVLLYPGTGSVLRGTCGVLWRTTGPWGTGDTVRLDYSPNGGSIWQAVPGAAALPFDAGTFAWDTSGFTPGSNYLLGATGTVGDPVTSGTFRVIAPTGTTFYVNDDSVAQDVYCTAPGDNANDGLSPATPKATLQDLQTRHALIPGDEVKIDTGTWDIQGILPIDYSGQSNDLIRFVGSTDPAGSLFRIGSINWNGIYLLGTDYVRLENLKVTGAYAGLRLAGTTGERCTGVEVVGCELFLNDDFGMHASYCDDLLVTGCDVYENDANTGMHLEYCYGATVSSNECHDGTYRLGIYLRGTGSIVRNEVYRNRTGIESRAYQGAIEVIDNHLYDNEYIGLAAEEGVQTIRANRSHNNGREGIYCNTSGGTLIESNVVYSCGYDGIHLNKASSAVRGNKAYSNGRYGMRLACRYNDLVENNLCYDNDTSGSGYYNMRVGYQDVWGGWYDVYGTVRNNTLYGGNGLQIGRPKSLVVENNVILAAGDTRVAVTVNTLPSPYAFTSDCNDWRLTAAATMGSWVGTPCADLAAWQGTVGVDSNSISLDPLFVDPDGPDDALGGGNGEDDDFHLQSLAGSYHVTGGWTIDSANSPCIDAGALSGSYAMEPWYHGYRVNQGAYGNTAAASKSELSNAYGVPNWWLELYDLDAGDTGEDGDEDGHFTWQEWVADTVPTNGDSVLRFEDTGALASGWISLTFQTVAGKTYRLWATTDLPAGGWTSAQYALTDGGALLSDPIAGTGGSMTVYVPGPADPRYLRVSTEL